MNISPFLNKLKDRLNSWKTGCGYTHFKEYDVVATEGRKFFKVYRKEIPNDGEKPHIQAESIVAFVDKITGDIFKPATYAAPAKWARGNVNSSENGMEAIDSAGFVKYLKNRG